MNPQSYQFCLYPSPFYRRLSRSSQLTQSLARVWGLTKESDSRGTNYCVVIRDDVLFQIQLDSSSSISQDEVIRVRKGVSSVSSVHFDRIQVDEDKCGEAGKRRVLLMRAPGQVALTVLTAFSTFSKQLDFELKLRHFLPPHLFIVFCLGSLRPIPLKLITGVSRMEIVEKTHWIDIHEGGRRVTALSNRVAMRMNSGTRNRDRVAHLRRILDETDPNPPASISRHPLSNSLEKGAVSCFERLELEKSWKTPMASKLAAVTASLTHLKNELRVSEVRARTFTVSLEFYVPL